MYIQIYIYVCTYTHTHSHIATIPSDARWLPSAVPPTQQWSSANSADFTHMIAMPPWHLTLQSTSCHDAPTICSVACAAPGTNSKILKIEHHTYVTS